MSPVVVKVPLNLEIQIPRNRLPIFKSLNRSQEDGEILLAVDYTQLIILIFGSGEETPHDERKEGHTQEHDNYR